MLKFALGFFVAMVSSFLVTGVYLGYYKSVEVKIDTPPSFYLLGIKTTGSYHLTNENIEKVEAWAKENNIDCPKSFGIYFDDPENIEPEKLTSYVGCVLDDKIESQLPENYSQELISEGKSYIAWFNGSPALGPLKVYPEAKDWFKKNNLQFPYSLEIYHLVDGEFKTQYIFPIPTEDVNPDNLKL